MAQANDSSEPPPDAWDEAFAQALIGRLILVGMTYVTPDGVVIRQEQFFGTVLSADRQLGIRIELQGSRMGDQHVLPPQTSNIQRARRGEYRLRSTGELVTDPDFITSWTLSHAAKDA